MRSSFGLTCMVFFVTLLAFATMETGCGPSTNTNNDAGITDAGTTADTGTTTDNGTATDTGTATDAGTATDNGNTADNGTATDAGTTAEPAPEKPAAPEPAVEKPVTPEPKPEVVQEQATKETPSAASIKISGVTAKPEITGSETPISGVEVCVYQTPSAKCVTSVGGGKFTIEGVPANKEIALTFKKKDHVSFLLTMVSQATDITISTNVVVTPKSTFNLLGTLLGKKMDFSQGFVAGAVTDAKGKGLKGASVKMVPASGDGPFYYGLLGTPDQSAKATSNNGRFIILNVAPTVSVDIAAAHPSNKNCVTGGWKGNMPGSAKVPVIAGFMSAAAVVCTP